MAADPNTLVAHNNVPGAVNHRRQLVSTEKHYFTFSKELINFQINSEEFCVVIKVDTWRDSAEWQYLFHVESNGNCFVIAKSPTMSDGMGGKIFFKVIINSEIQLEGESESRPRFDKEIYLLIGKKKGSSWLGCWAYEKPVDLSFLPVGNIVIGSGRELFKKGFAKDGFIGCCNGESYFCTLKLVYFVMSKKYLLVEYQDNAFQSGDMKIQ